MNPTALKAAAKVGFPRDHVLGVWWAGSEEDVIPAGDAAKGYVSAAFSAPGSGFPVMQEIHKLYTAGKGNLQDPERQGSIYHTRGVTYGIIITEAIRTAQEKFGKGKAMTGEQVRWGLENLDLSEARIKALGAAGMFPPIKTSCADHEGSGMVKFQVWDGKAFKPVTGFMHADAELVRKMVEEYAAKYAAEKKITPRDCKGA
jgi:branched-chain amino acid transport system substrate-binding protein